MSLLVPHTRTKGGAASFAFPTPAAPKETDAFHIKREKEALRRQQGSSRKYQRTQEEEEDDDDGDDDASGVEDSILAPELSCHVRGDGRFMNARFGELRMEQEDDAMLNAQLAQVMGHGDASLVLARTNMRRVPMVQATAAHAIANQTQLHVLCDMDGAVSGTHPNEVLLTGTESRSIPFGTVSLAASTSVPGADVVSIELDTPSGGRMRIRLDGAHFTRPIDVPAAATKDGPLREHHEALLRTPGIAFVLSAEEVSRERGRVNPPDANALWVQCDTCAKWRRLPSSVDPMLLPQKWFCHMHPLARVASCDAPQQLEGASETPYAMNFCAVCLSGWGSSRANALLSCQGGCQRSFHVGCVVVHGSEASIGSEDEARAEDVGLSVADILRAAPWYCDTCLTYQHVCFFCGKAEGPLDRKTGAGGDLIVCPFMCGKFYHRSCFFGVPQSAKRGRKRKLGGATVVAMQCHDPSVADRVACAQHRCATCKRVPTFAAPLRRCIRCPLAFHTNARCAPDGLVPVGETHCICPRHPRHPTISLVKGDNVLIVRRVLERVPPLGAHARPLVLGPDGAYDLPSRPPPSLVVPVSRGRSDALPPKPLPVVQGPVNRRVELLPQARSVAASAAVEASPLPSQQQQFLPGSWEATQAATGLTLHGVHSNRETNSGGGRRALDVEEENGVPQRHKKSKKDYKPKDRLPGVPLDELYEQGRLPFDKTPDHWFSAPPVTGLEEALSFVDEDGTLLAPLVLSSRLVVLALGTIVHDRDSFHDRNVLFPVGFMSVYDVDSDSEFFLFEIQDDGDAPRFRITPFAKDGDRLLESRGMSARSSIDELWSTMRKQVYGQSNGQAKVGADPGLEAFGIALFLLRQVLEALPGSDSCANYVRLTSAPLQNGAASDSARSSFESASEPQRRSRRRRVRTRKLDHFEV